MNGAACGTAVVPLKRVAPLYLPHSHLHPLIVSVHVAFPAVSSFKVTFHPLIRISFLV